MVGVSPGGIGAVDNAKKIKSEGGRGGGRASSSALHIVLCISELAAVARRHTISGGIVPPLGVEQTVVIMTSSHAYFGVVLLESPSRAHGGRVNTQFGAIIAEVEDPTARLSALEGQGVSVVVVGAVGRDDAESSLRVAV